MYSNVSVLAIFPREQETRFEFVEEEKNGVHRVIVYYKFIPNSNPFKAITKRLRYLKACKIGFNHCEKKLGSIDIIHLNVVLPLGLFATYLKRIKKFKFVITEHATAYAPGPNQYPSKALSRASGILRKADHILPVSSDLGRTLKEIAPNVDQTVVANVVNEEIFKHQSASPNKKRFIHISTTIDEHKNVTGILNATAKLKESHSDFELLIVSDGDVKAHQAKASALSLNETVQFEGRKSTEEIAQLVEASTALVLFSNYENFPCVIAEAMMIGRPTISTAVNGIPEHVSQSNGILVEKGNVDELVEAMRKVLDREFVCKSKELHDYAMEHFSYQAVGKQLTTIYRRLL